MDVCWPKETDPSQGIALTLIRDEKSGAVNDVMFEAKNGASNGIGRCAREIALTYPWEPSTAPATVELTPPISALSGWLVLAYVQLISQSTYGPERGLLDPGAKVSACLSRGNARRLHYRVLTSPVRVAAFNVDQSEAQPVTEAERCVLAVLAATSYPGTRNYELDFANEAGAPPPAPEADVALYFGPKDFAPAQPIDPQEVRDTMVRRQPQISACWESALKRRAGLSGGRSLRLRVSPAGQVSFAQVIANQAMAEGEAVDYLLDRCLVDAVAGARFPSGGDAIYSWVFAARAR